MVEEILFDAIARGLVTYEELEARLATSGHRAGIAIVRRALARLQRDERRRAKTKMRRTELVTHRREVLERRTQTGIQSPGSVVKTRLVCELSELAA